MKLGHFIDGEWVHPEAAHMMPVEDPSSGQIIAQVPAGGRPEAEQALNAARRAAGAWAETPAVKRASYLLNVVKLLRERVHSFAETIMAEQGKPLTQARGEVAGAALQLEYHAQWEVFGPIASVLRFSDFSDALAQANDSDYGLSAYLFTNDYRQVMRAVNELQFGEVFVNRVGPEAVNAFHSGYRLSGIGGDDGRYGFEAYLRKKTIYLGRR